MIRGVLLPIITPFDEKVRVDEQMMRQLVDFHIKAGVQGLFVLGSTGQGPAMTIEERKQTAADRARSGASRGCRWSSTSARRMPAAPWNWRSMRRRTKPTRWRSCRPITIPITPNTKSSRTTKRSHKAVPLPIFIYENPKYSGISIPPDLRRAHERAGADAQRHQSRLRPGRAARIRAAAAGRFGFHRQRRSVRPRAFRPRRNDQSADQLRAGALRRVVEGAGQSRLYESGGGAEKESTPPRDWWRRDCASTAACPCKKCIACAAST